MSSNFFSPSSHGGSRTIREAPGVARFDAFLRSPGYIVTLAILTVVCNLLSADLIIYTIFVFTGMYIVLFASDFLGMMPLVVLSYVAPSPSNNPGSASNTGSVFYPENGGIYLIVLAVLLVACLVFRLVTDQEIGGKAFATKPRKLLGGMLLLSGGYLLSGIGMEFYDPATWKMLVGILGGTVAGFFLFLCWRRKSSGISFKEGLGQWRLMLLALIPAILLYALTGISGLLGDLPKRNLLFALIQCVAVVVMYYIFTGTVRWSRVPKGYLAWIGMCLGFVVLVQLLENYFSGRIFMPGTGTIDRELIYAGWGMHNNIGGMMAFMLPFPFYLAYTQKRSWLFNILGTILMLGVIVSCSRTSMLVALVIYGICVVLLMRRKECRKANLAVCGVIFAAVILIYVVFFRRLVEIFDLFFEELFVMSERDNLLSYGFKQFLNAPIFGGSFFPQGEYVPWDWSTSAAFSSFFPPRWHNTVIQILASCGIVGFGAYCLHRVQTIKLLLNNRSTENLFIALCLGALVICSLMDCHFFNVGPVLFYSMALAYSEHIHESTV